VPFIIVHTADLTVNSQNSDTFSSGVCGSQEILLLVEPYENEREFSPEFHVSPY
jgi:hypothetical protein